jgi:putative membrane protein
MRSTGFLALACAAALTIACRGDARNDQPDSPDISSSEAVGTAGDTVAHGNDGDARQFAIQASKKGAAEVELGRLASERAQNSSVKSFAQMMVQDHSKAGEELKQAVMAQGGEVNQELPDDSEDLLDKLKGLQGADFDREYMEAMVDAHQEMRGMVSGRINDARRMTTTPSGLEMAVNQWAEKTLPRVEQHLAKAEEIRNTLKGKATDTY